MIIKKQENPNLNETTNIKITQILELSEINLKFTAVYQEKVLNF